MLYDEEGRPYIEPPLLPDDQRLYYIVTDYHRMYVEFGKLERKIEKQRAKLMALSNFQYALRRIIQQQENHIKKLKDMLKARGAKIPEEILNYQGYIRPIKCKGNDKGRTDKQTGASWEHDARGQRDY